jgi:DNA-binding protein Fis
MFISVVSWRMGEQIEVFQHSSLEEAKQEVRKQLINYNEGEDIAQVYEIVLGQKQPKFICNQHDIIDQVEY